MAEDTASRIRRLPKAELHLHLEGSTSPAILLELSRKYSSDLKAESTESLAEKLFQYRDFAQFLETYKIVCQHLREPDDYVKVLNHLSRELVEQNVRYAEVIVAPSIPHRFGFDDERILGALLDRSREIEGEGGPILRWIFDCVRQWGTDSARYTAELAVAHRADGVVALGLGGDEKSLPMSGFEEVFTWAKAQQLFIHVHAGEIGGPEQIWDALKILGANRIGHGIQAARDSRLMEYLREHTIGLDICLTSNSKTGAWTPISKNPFGMLFRRGLPVSVNTDDPGLFQTTLTQELVKAVELFDLTPEELDRLILQSLRSAFLAHEERMALMQEFTNEIHSLK